MFIEVNLTNLTEQHALYSLTTEVGDLIHVGIVPFKQLTAFNDVPFKDMPSDVDYSDTAYLTIIEVSDDRLKLANAGTEYTTSKKRLDLRDRLVDAINSWTGKSNANEVECIETGEVFQSAQAAATAHDLTYGALLAHLQRRRGYKTVKGRTYRKVGS